MQYRAGMDATGDLLTVSKYVLIGLIYLVLFAVVIAVGREMRQRVEKAEKAPATTPGRVKIIESGSDPRLQTGQVLTLGSETMIGADDENDLVLVDNFVSGRHACLRWDGVSWSLEDLGSTNGSFVNGQRCPPHEEQRVPFGATLQMGDVVLQLIE
jgi:hypothetical protein